jgi:hypothetical protein
MRILKYIILPFTAITLASSCQKVINVDLNKADTKYVVEANVVDDTTGCTVKLSKTVNFDQSNVFPAVSGAVVVIKDVTAGTTYTLPELRPGFYRDEAATGIPGHSYEMSISVDGKVFTASGIMPQHVNMDTIYRTMGVFDSVTAISYFDPVAKGNYYYFAEYNNGAQTDNIFITTDEFKNGQQITQNMNRGGGDFEEQAGDYITLDMQCIDSAMYQYYYSLRQTKNQNSATPANPLTNISGGALGYFSAHTSSRKSVIIH